MSDPVQLSQIRYGKSTLQLSQIRYGKSTLSQTLIVSDPVQISQIRFGKSSISQPFSVTNLGNPDHV